MKKWIVYILSLTALVASLCACGTADKPAATNAPRPSGTPMTATPDMNDGIVNDDDGGHVGQTVRLCAGDGWRSKKVKNTPPGPKWTGGAFCKARKPVSRVLSAQPSI